MLEIVNRLKKVKGLTWNDLSKDIGITSAGLRVAFERGSVDDVYLDHVCKILEVDKSVFDTDVVNEPSTEHKSSKNVKTIPFYDIDAIGGDVRKGAVMEAILQPNKNIDVGDFLRDSESAMRVYGNSMLPNYPSGCVVGFKLVTDSIIEPGKVYIIETVDNRYLKRIYKRDDGLECYSDNQDTFKDGVRKGKPYYEPFTIPFDAILRIFRVTGVIKRNENSF